MNKIISLLLIAISYSSLAQPIDEKPKILYGACTKESLVVEPFGNWYNPNYDSYQPEAIATGFLKKQNFDNISIKIFFGTWCGDSKREVPRFLKLLSEISFPGKKVQLIALGGSDSLIKQSPQHEEAGLGIFRVPTFIIYKNGIEINRINEFPVYSLEKDLVNILNDQRYIPNYHSFGTVLSWIREGALTDANISTRGLAVQLRQLVNTENELNSLGHLLLKQEKKKEGIRLLEINYSLYPESSKIVSSLGEGYYQNGDYRKAVAQLEKALELNKDPKAVKEILAILYKAKEREAESK